jgi:hypothetical protein
MHCFSSGPRLAEAALEMGFYLSMSGIAAFPKSQESARHLRQRAARPHPGGNRQPLSCAAALPRPRNEPAYVAHTARIGAQVFGMTRGRIRRRHQANFDRLFTRAAAVKGAPDGTAALHHPGLRLLGRRAAHRRRLGRLRPDEPEEPPPPLLASGRTEGRTGTTRC